MNPQMRSQLDAVCREVAAAHVPPLEPTQVQIFITINLFVTKLVVLGDNSTDKKINMAQTLRDMASEMSNILIIACTFLPKETGLHDAKAVLALYQVVADKCLPIIRFFYFGISPSDKKELEEKKIIVSH